MATYLSGVVDYIPQLQPFQPDLNLYANVLQTKQTQYDTAWKSLNNVYGQYFYADLTRDNNIARKEEIIKNIDFNLKRVAGLDLSLSQNVAQATQVFKPFYEDDYLMKDMAWTKNYSNQRTRAEGYKNSLKEEQRGMYWDGGVRALDYMREEFKEASDTDSLNFGNAEYTPYVNAVKEAQKVAKEAGLSIETVDFSGDGKWIVTTKNGEQLMEPLSKLFEAQLGSDPAIQAVYKTQAYLDRKDYAASNAAQFNGDKNAAEMQYLQTNYTMLKEQQRLRYEQMEEENSVYDAKIKDVEKQLETKKSAQLTSYLNQLKTAKQTNQAVLDRVAADNEALAEQDGTATTTTGQENPYGDLRSLRWKVDNAVASSLMEKDFNEAAQIFAMKDAKQSIEANPYAVNEQKHQFAMQEVALRNQGLENAAKIRNAGEMEKLRMQAALDAGVAAINPYTGEMEMVKSYENIYTTSDLEGAASQGESFATVGRRFQDETTQQYAQPYLDETVLLLEKAKGQGVISDKQIKEVLGMDLATFTSKYGGNKNAFINNNLGSKGLSDLKARMDNFVKSNNKLSVISQGQPGFNAATTKLSGFTAYQRQMENWRLESSNEVKQKLEAQGFKDADLLFDKNGHMRGYEEFKANMEVRYGKGALGSEEAPSGGFWKTSMIGAGAALGLAGAALGFGFPAAAEAYKGKGGESVSYENYAKLWRAANDVYSSNMNTQPPPGIAASPLGGGSIASTGQQNISVSNKAPGMAGFQYWKQFERELRNTPYTSKVESGNANRFSINGQDEAAFKNYDNDLGLLVINHVANQMANTKNRFNFDFAAAPVAANDANIGAMVIKITPDMIKDLVATDKDQKNNVITQEQANLLYKNGLTTFKEGGWGNGLYASSYMDPISAVIASGGTFEETDIYGTSSFKAEKDILGIGDYAVTRSYKVIDPNTGDYIKQEDVIRDANIGRNMGTIYNQWGQNSEFINNYNNGIGIY